MNIEHLKQVLLVIRKIHCFDNVDKYTFCVDSVIFLCFVVKKNWVSCEPQENQSHLRVANCIKHERR